MIEPKEIKVLDKNAEYYGIPTLKLMENAGKNTAEFIFKKINPQKNCKILFLCGTGNNGGDGFVAARYLSKKYMITVFLTGKPEEIKTKISKENYQ